MAVRSSGLTNSCLSVRHILPSLFESAQKSLELSLSKWSNGEIPSVLQLTTFGCLPSGQEPPEARIASECGVSRTFSDARKALSEMPNGCDSRDLNHEHVRGGAALSMSQVAKICRYETVVATTI